jgi:hypothetical protein
MRWKKLGLVFTPQQHALVTNGAGWAQSPDAVVFDNFVRIFFSTRCRDGDTGKYLSYVVFADMSKDLGEVIRVSSKPVIGLGGLGCFDEHGIKPMNMTRVRDALYGYTTGFSRRLSVQLDMAIGLAVSNDEGESFERVGPGPVLGASLNEPCMVGDGCVRLIGDEFHMWYVSGRGWRRYAERQEPDRIYKLGHATSADGINWTKEDGLQIVGDVLGEDECYSRPTVITLEGEHHLFFGYRHAFDFRTNPERSYRIGHARSTDLASWTRDDAFLPLEPGRPGQWDSEMVGYPCVFECDRNVYLLYNGNEFGRYGFGAAVLER